MTEGLRAEQKQDSSWSHGSAGYLSKSLDSTFSDWPNPDNTDSIKSAFSQSAGEDGLLRLEELSNLLEDLRLQAPSDVVLGLVEATASSQWALTLDETLAVCAALREQQTSTGQAQPPQSPTGSLRALSQRRAYMDSGWLAQDQAVIAYMKKLELHK